jgi:1-acyl-sn-glycerol-3-phosphate acyltransferase
VIGAAALLISWLAGSAWPLYRVAVPAVRVALWLAGVRLRVVGRERLQAGQNYLFMPNHQSNVDPPVVLLALRRDARMMAKASLFRIPLLGQALRLGRFVPIVREDREAAIASVGQAAEELRRGLDFVVFPEGTRSRDGQLLELKKGPFFMALEGGVPVVPVRIDGSRRVMRRGERVIQPGLVDVRILAPIETASLGGSEEARREQVRERVRSALGLAQE